ncbi:MAG TPA: ion transporter [Candidatus Hydrogenedentes bacterium]|jgi:voltage-gated potassium channel|nr:ion transporter [Candidatus Hydrogenedentota bacterium]
MTKPPSFKIRTHEIIFEADTREGKMFDVVLIVTILLSVVAVMLESVESVRESYGQMLTSLEWFFTILFTVEYLLRLYSVGKPVRYATSFFGIVDLLAIIPTYLSLFLVGSQFLIVVRVLRLLRIFRVLRFVKFLREMEELRHALLASRRKIFVFVFAVMLVAIIAGSLMYVIEGEENGYTSIPKGIYWAVVTMTTVGYGDIAPHTNAGQVLATILMIMGYGIIAVPTGIVTSELTRPRRREDVVLQSCPQCSTESYERNAKFCSQCGAEINP